MILTVYQLLLRIATVLCNIAFLFNVGPRFLLCNVREICAILAPYLQQPAAEPVIIKKLTGPK